MKKAKNPKLKYFKIAAVIVVIVAAVVLFWIWLRNSSYWDIITDKDKLQAWIADFGFWAPFVFFGLQVSQVIISLIPGNVFMVAGGMVFGFWPSFLLSFAAVLLGSLAGFMAVRLFGPKVIKWMVGQTVYDKYEAYMNKNVTVTRARTILIITMLLPFFPDDAICFIAGLTPIGVLDFVIIIFLTRPWGIAFASYVGDRSEAIPVWGWVVIVAFFVGLAVVSIKYAAVLEDKTLKNVHKVENWFRRLTGRKTVAEAYTAPDDSPEETVAAEAVQKNAADAAQPPAEQNEPSNNAAEE